MPNGWLNVPHFKQEFNYSCVAACVRMVLAHYGHSKSEGDLRQLLGTTPHGTRAVSVSRVAPLGFDVQFGASNLLRLQATLAANVPSIVFLLTGALDYWNVNDAHAVVLVGMDVATVYLNDPFFGTFPQQTSLVSFQQAWATTGHLAAVIRPCP
jgi:ABC-type bacteriocin/lantibiotic exporter with double-glycine peptidase domain